MTNKPKTSTYLCFSPRLNLFLMIKGVRYIHNKKHQITGKWYWEYIRNEELDQALGEYSKIKEKAVP